LNELTQLTDVCDVLKSIHIAIGFLSSAGGNPLMSIHEYLHQGLKMTPKNGLKSGKVHVDLFQAACIFFSVKGVNQKQHFFM
jgi:hypothetical protein